MAKKSSAETSVYAVREAMELMGGMGYIEDGVMPKIMRDMMVLPIWEGAGNIMILDMLRAAVKSKGLGIIFAEIETEFESASASLYLNEENWQNIITHFMSLKALIGQLQNEAQDIMETTAKIAFERLSKYYQLSCLLRYYDEDSAKWIGPAIEYYSDVVLYSKASELKAPASLEKIKNLLAWDF
jgi:hypothetical protein